MAYCCYRDNHRALFDRQHRAVLDRHRQADVSQCAAGHPNLRPAASLGVGVALTWECLNTLLFATWRARWIWGLVVGGALWGREARGILGCAGGE